MLLAFAMVIVLSVCGMLGFVVLAVSGQWQPAAVRESFVAYQRSYALSLGDYYVANGNSWSGVQERFDGISFAGPGNFFDYALADPGGRVIASNDSALPIGATVVSAELDRGLPIDARGQRVGILIVRGGPRPLQPMPPMPPQMPSQPVGGRAQRDIAWPLIRGFLIAAVALAVTLLLLAIFFVQRISRPLRRLTAAAKQLATGQLDVQVGPAPIREVNELTQAFNSMAVSLAAADRQRRQMTADIAHELRTPLTIIKGRLEGLQDGVYRATPDELDRLLGETALLERLIDDLRLLALAETGQLALYREPIDARDLLEGARSAFAGQAAAQGVQIVVQAPADLPLIDADPQRMAQVLANLVSNALRYTPEGGSITLLAHQPTIDQRLASSVVLRISDTGQGIAAEDLPHVFDRFYRADRSRARSSGGAGLGLAITKQIVLAHGGTIEASSVEGQGAAFTIALPLAPDQAG